ncbi:MULTISPECIES: IclR family transcriptional regulator [Streptomyces]|uniref:IclR family transcriptional regulator n=1 Tax=Streptomyces TaxID=1883 RepID=UPI00093ED6F9|nr:IclR family transcriptional regulator [Streptomyces sp. CB02115]OKJ53265.1 hypothetical protein AMK28_24340 [Streptomyces sp. CB02115]
MQLVKRALGVLRIVADSDGGVTLRELATQLDIPLSSMHRLIAVLEESKCLGRSSANRTYFLGPAARRFVADNHMAQPLSSPHPTVGELWRKTGGTVSVTELLGEQAVCTMVLQSDRPLRLFTQYGQSMPMHAAACARVLLADQPETLARRVLRRQPLTSFTRNTPGTVESVCARFEKIRRCGYETSLAELDEGVFVAAAPVRFSTGRTRAAVAVTVPLTAVLTETSRRALIETVVEAAAEVSLDLGYVSLAA